MQIYEPIKKNFILFKMTSFIRNDFHKKMLFFNEKAKFFITL